jgi:hypothetical protein
MKTLFYSLLFISIALSACNTRYSYRTKIKVNHTNTLVKKEIQDSTLEAAAEEHYHAIDNTVLRDIEHPDTLFPSSTPKHTLVKESLLALKRIIADTTIAEYTISPKTKRLNTLVETAPWRKHKHTTMSSVTGGVSSNTMGIIGLVTIFLGIALSSIAALAGQTGDKLLGFLLFSTMLVFFGLLFLLLALIISIVDN